MIRAFYALPVLALTAGAAFAQAAETPAAPAPMQMDAGVAYESARNQLGVLEYCTEKGHIDGKAVEIQTKLLTLIPEGDKAKGDAAEAKGKSGTVAAMGVEQSLDAASKAQNSSEEALCKQMDTMIQALAAQLPQ
ncbi:pore-forming ESAT-6 family protein [Paracoccus aminophilus]|uniref:Uncharacterized protein n=1 Tax=Paracoccus aminophilus JCM 7686 TaxID=1367847 RepID=S5YBB7_PARAH|nr:pore-forming ESAT-6 family protein [Paracoccus aminophilus]AGT08743.1 hypothetical protein JCM7686_1642 [Paracoccus aminophilus JCM 7686]